MALICLLLFILLSLLLSLLLLFNYLFIFHSTPKVLPGLRVFSLVKPSLHSRWIHIPYCPCVRSFRHVLARPVEDRLFFAGEATSLRSCSTVPTAIETGIRVSDQVCLAARKESCSKL